MRISPSEQRRIDASGYQSPFARDCCGRCESSTIESTAPAFRCLKHNIAVAKLGICKEFTRSGGTKAPGDD